MSETYEIACLNCQVKLCIGQAPYGNPHRFYLYGGNIADSEEPPEIYSPLGEFLMRHQEHTLQFFSFNSETFSRTDEYLELEHRGGLRLIADRDQPLSGSEYSKRKADYLEQTEDWTKYRSGI
jgi:hypothetical protein